MIYFAQPVEGGPIKIGHSKNVDTRIKQLESDYKKPLALLALQPGGRSEEQAIHAKFAHLRFAGTEQFRPSLDLMEFINRPLLVGANPEAVEVMVQICRVTLLNLKGSEEERDFIRSMSDDSGVSASEIVRRGLAMWATKRGYTPPKGWKAE